MQSTLSVGSDSRSLDNWTESDIIQAINRRRKVGEIVCVRVHLVKLNCADASFTTPACAGGIGGGRQANPCERKLFEAWERNGLNQQNYEAENVVAFLRQASHILN